MAHLTYTDSLESKSSVVVVAIELGTTHSGCVCSLRCDYEKNPLNISSPSDWDAEYTGIASTKTPTVILLNPDLTFNSFGYEAEYKYMELTEDNKHHDYYYFRHFRKMIHHSMNMEPEMVMIEDSNKREVKALTVFALAINYIKARMMSNLNKMYKYCEDMVCDDEIYWILTVPAMWNERAKQFMREAAKMAGIKRQRIGIVLEPEAATSFCMHLPVDKWDGQGQPLAKGIKYMVADVGSETVKVSMYEVVDTGKLMELGHMKELECGIKNVHAAFDSFLEEILGPDIFYILRRKYPDEYRDVHKQLNASRHTTGKMAFKIPVEWLEGYTEETAKRGQGKQWSDRLKEMKEEVVMNSDRIRVPSDIVRSWLDEPCKIIVEHVRECLKYKMGEGINTMLLVGEFSEFQMLQDAFRSTFSDKRVIIPNEAEFVVLKGAVLYGHNPLTLEHRRNLFSCK